MNVVQAEVGEPRGVRSAECGGRRAEGEGRPVVLSSCRGVEIDRGIHNVWESFVGCSQVHRSTAETANKLLIVNIGIP